MTLAGWWLALALVLGIAELLVPGVFLVFVAAAAACVVAVSPVSAAQAAVASTKLSARFKGVAAGTQVRLVVDEQRGAVRGRKLVDPAAADDEHAVGCHLGGVGQQRPRHWVHMRSGASMPSSEAAQSVVSMMAGWLGVDHSELRSYHITIRKIC